ncbi:Protein CBG01291 [Caenorhabditis briggsae]|uniref:Protein CBG01291 n=1 Tax=Caenorhabditis briggsae TaxID=6238 RepID=A8WQ22_CAEBR|nr:Protein CBG01291 [Caenorhabditis briggsae]CAP22580.2 Protein CBG01291 [Caenorhabditis briggsae]
MYLSAAIINTVAISFPFISMIIYAKLLLMIFWFKTIKQAPELSLFYFKFVFDLVISVISLVKMIIYALAMLPTFLNFFNANHWLTFLVIWLICLISSLRAILVFFIAMDRTCATYLPITFFKYRKFIPTILIIGLATSYSLVDISVAFWICKADLNTPTTCVNGLCVLGACYQDYWLEFQKYIYALIIALTCLLCLKLFIWNRVKKHNVSQDLRRLYVRLLCIVYDLTIFSHGINQNKGVRENSEFISSTFSSIFVFLHVFLDSTSSPNMYTSAIVINTVAISFPFISMIVYGRLLLMIFWFKTIQKSPELYLFYCKFVFDLVISFISFIKMIIYGLSMTSWADFFFANHWLTFMFVWPVSSFSTLRAILVLLIAVDRTCATYIPIKFFKYRKLIPTYFIIGLVLSYSIIDTSVAFLICQIDLSTPTDCVSAQCINGACYQRYWLVFSQILYALIIALTLLLCLKIFFWNKANLSGDLKRANRLAMINAFILFIFNFLPPIANSVFSNYFEYVGAMNSVCQTLGFVVESWLTNVSMRQKYRVTVVTSSGKVVQRSTVEKFSEYK